ncbi:hypothetical protein PANDA_008994 [Ailuropoda melanoleuca]|uniref:Protein kinase domain-containing protein n=1 Tax=Ailuropoda melanoleuca TaxID=9646 RepID=D2HE12_AILME|nr:hypothetical protein PANDA_008994 [Ailuropoda melanoleuca]
MIAHRIHAQRGGGCSKICVTKMSTRNCQGMDSVIKPLDTIPEDKKVRVQRTQSTFDPFEKPANQVKRVHSENNACINFKSSSTGKESPKVRRHSSPSSPTSPKFGKADSYEKLEKLGEGSYATVYKGKSNSSCVTSRLKDDSLIPGPEVSLAKVNGKLVALKVIRLQEEEGTPFTAIREEPVTPSGGGGGGGVFLQLKTLPNKDAAVEQQLRGGCAGAERARSSQVFSAMHDSYEGFVKGLEEASLSFLITVTFAYVVKVMEFYTRLIQRSQTKRSIRHQALGVSATLGGQGRLVCPGGAAASEPLHTYLGSGLLSFGVRCPQHLTAMKIKGNHDHSKALGKKTRKPRP